MIWPKILRASLRSLRANAVRSGLTALGVVIGVASIVVVVSVSDGTRAQISAAISALGSDRIDINGGSTRGAVAARLMFGGLYSLTDGDYEAIKAGVRNIAGVSSSISGSVQLAAGDRSWTTRWDAVHGDYFAVNRLEASAGRALSAQELLSVDRVAVVGETVRTQLFGEAQAPGKTISINRLPFLVVGSLEPKGRGPSGEDLDDRIIVPMNVGRRFLLGDFPMPRAALQRISVKASSDEDLESVRVQLLDLLRSRHNITAAGEEDFILSGMKDLVSAKAQSTKLLSALLTTVALVCLLVGGIGVMNIMLVSVTERIGEIGLRLAVGAAPSQIQLQFLAEAVMLTFIGGLVGLSIGIGAALLYAHTYAVPILIGPRVIVFAFAASVIVGLLFGFYPARKASKLPPIVALRHR